MQKYSAILWTKLNTRNEIIVNLVRELQLLTVGNIVRSSFQNFYIFKEQSRVSKWILFFNIPDYLLKIKTYCLAITLFIRSSKNYLLKCTQYDLPLVLVPKDWSTLLVIFVPGSLWNCWMIHSGLNLGSIKGDRARKCSALR